MLLRGGWGAPDFVQMPRGIDLFCLYVLFSQYKSFDNTLNNCFCQISTLYYQSSALYLHLTVLIMKRQRVKFPWDLKWKNMAKLKRFIPRGNPRPLLYAEVT